MENKVTGDLELNERPGKVKMLMLMLMMTTTMIMMMMMDLLVYSRRRV